MLILLYYFEWCSAVLIFLACFLNLQDIFKEWHLSLHSGIYPRQKAASPPAWPEETPQGQLFLSRLLFLQLLCKQLTYSKVETSYTASVNFQLCWRFLYWVTVNLQKVCLLSQNYTILCSITFFPISRTVYEIMWKCVVHPERPQKT